MRQREPNLTKNENRGILIYLDFFLTLCLKKWTFGFVCKTKYTLYNVSLNSVFCIQPINQKCESVSDLTV